MSDKPKKPGRNGKGGPPTPEAGLLVGERYLLRELLGTGGHGDVWEAEDQVGRGLVAVKLLRADGSATPARLGSEVSILRLNQLPGVVRLLDEHLGGPLPYIVMERLRGEPFPGAGRRGSWERLANTAVALIETLVRLHAGGVVHQDLKPANVLVDAGGKPTVLDFGIASDRRIEELPDDGYLDGTIHYMAPERLRGQPITPQADLYALGVLLFQALTDRLPHQDAHGKPDLIRICAQTPAPPVRKIAPETPPEVAGLVDLLLSKDPSRRPQSAVDVLGILRGHPRREGAETRFPHPAADAARDAVLARIRRGLPVDLVGPRATGRSTCLGASREAIEREGRRAVLLRPSSRAFGSVTPLLGAPLDPSLRLADAREVVVARLSAALADGVVVLADDVDRMDRPSAAALAMCRERGALVRVFEEAPPGDDGSIVRLAPLDEEALGRLFAGPERLYHLRSDGARILRARTGGLPGRVSEEIGAWIRAGAASSNGEQLSISRDLLEELDARVMPQRLGHLSSEEHVALPKRFDELLAWLDVAWPDGTPDILAACMQKPAWDIEADLDELVERGFARRAERGTFEPTSLPLSAREWSAERRRADHRAVAEAMSPGAPRRFFHMASALDPTPAAADVAALAEEAVALARRLMHADEGDLRRAMVVLQEAEFQIRRWPAKAEPLPGNPEERVLAAIVDLALAEGTDRVVGRARYEISRARTRTKLVARLEQLLDGALAYGAGGERSLRLLDAIPPFADPGLERRRQGLRARASRRCSVELEDATMADIAAWAEGSSDPVTQARLAFWQGWWHYRRDRYADAARLHKRAALGEPSRAGRILALIASVSALMESSTRADLDEAAERADEALREARGSGSPYLEARAEWARRAAAYRRGVDDGPDVELTEAAADLRSPDVEATICLTEAAFAYRRGERGVARELSERAARLWKFVRNDGPFMLARSLALSAGGEPESPDEVANLARRAMECPTPGLGIQALGLLARATGDPPHAWTSAAPRLAALVPREAWPRPLDVLSVQEALDALRAPSPRRRP